MDIHDFKLPFSWRCPVCSHAVIIGDHSIHRSKSSLVASDKGKLVLISSAAIRCPNAACNDIFVAVKAEWARYKLSGPHTVVEPVSPIGIGNFTFAPSTGAPLSATVPQSVQSDYNEAYLIRTLSPKASATLSRRALQGMIRDRWGVRKRTLDAEIKAVEEYCDPDLYQAMMDLKSIGNIGAHPEKDADVIIDIEDGEAEELLQLLKYLDDEWYAAREKKRRRLASINEMAGRKEAARTPDQTS